MNPADKHFAAWRKLAATLGDQKLREAIKTGAGENDERFYGSANVDADWFTGARRILDFGAGLGRNAPAILALEPLIELTLFDSPEMIERARERLRERLSPDDWERVRFADTWGDLAGQSFDLVFCCLVAQHITPPALLARLADFQQLAPRLLVFGRRWNDAAGQGSSTWEVILRSGWRAIRCDDTFALAQGAEVHNYVLFAR